MNRTLLFALGALVLAFSPDAHAQWGAITTNSPQICLREEGGWVNTRACDASVNHFQAVYHSNRNAFTIRTGSGGCLDATAGSGSPSSGQPVRSVVCNGRSSQDWWLHENGQIQNQANRNLCVRISGGSVASGRQVIVHTCDFSGNRMARRLDERFAFGGTVRATRAGERVVSTTNLQSSNLVRQVPIANGNTAAVIAPGGGNVIAAGGNNVIAAGGNNVIAAGGNNVIGHAGGN